MKTREEVTADKLRGGFYSPQTLVDFVLSRLKAQRAELTGRILEPSVGDGAFLHGLRRAKLTPLEVLGVEVLGPEAAKARWALGDACIPGRVINDSTLRWSLTRETGEFDVVLGNLPFVRFQFIGESDRHAAAEVMNRAGLTSSGVSNLWLPMLIASLSQLRPGGTFALILPAECFTGVSAGKIREWLLRKFENLIIDLFPPGSFPGALQEVVVASGRRTEGDRQIANLALIEHKKHSGMIELETAHAIHHSVPPSPTSWTRLMLSARHLQAYEHARNLAVTKTLSALATFEVSTVTGANSYFSVNGATVKEFQLGEWVIPLLPRIRHAAGIRFSVADYSIISNSEVSAYLLAVPHAIENTTKATAGLLRYITLGENQNLHERFKCRIREPWYSVPGIRISPLMLTKRSHHHPRMVLNEASAVTTDTIYRGRPKPGVSADALTATFHNSLTLLSAELEGRSFGGGVLELVPSEVSRLLMPDMPHMATELERLDTVAREATLSGDPNSLVDETDRLLEKMSDDWTTDLLETLAEGRRELQSRRFARN